MAIRVATLKKCYNAMKASKAIHGKAKPLETHPYRRYLKHNFSRMQRPGESSQVVILKLQLLYSKFANIRRRYATQAAKDKVLLRDMQEKSKNHRINAYSLYLKENFAAVNKKLPVMSSHRQRIRAVWQQVSAQWKALSSEQKAVYVRQAKEMHSAAKGYIENIQWKQ